VKQVRAYWQHIAKQIGEDIRMVRRTALAHRYYECIKKLCEISGDLPILRNLQILIARILVTPPFSPIGRVNGQQSASQIFGTIDSTTFYPSANLFLMNPYGFLFGPVAVCPQHKHLWTVGAEPPSSVPAPEASPNH